MKRAIPFLLGMSIAAAGSLITAAQQPATMPKVIQIQREFIKPGKAGAIHDKSESNFVQAMARAKWPTRYIALNSMSGKSRALYLVGYDSFASWQKDNDATEKNAALSADLERASVSDGELLDSYDSAVLYYDEVLSYRPMPDLTHARYIEISAFHIKPGHGKEWHDLAKMYVDGYKKAGIDANFATYEVEYGAANEFLLFSADTGLDQIDSGMADDKKFRDAVGEDGVKQVRELEASAVGSVDSELFSINPKQSYPPDAWVTANPSFWKPKPMGAAAKPAAPMMKPPQ